MQTDVSASCNGDSRDRRAGAYRPDRCNPPTGRADAVHRDTQNRPIRPGTSRRERPVAESDQSSKSGRTARPAGDKSGTKPVALCDPEQKQDQKKNQKQPPAKKSPAAREPFFEIPKWVNQPAWDGFEQMRRKLRYPLTPRAAELVIRRLAELRDEGHDPNAVLDQSTRNAWRDVYPIKKEAQDGSSKPKSGGNSTRTYLGKPAAKRELTPQEADRARSAADRELREMCGKLGIRHVVGTPA